MAKMKSAPQGGSSIGQNQSGIYVGSLPVETNTYAGVCSKLGLKRGDHHHILFGRFPQKTPDFR